MIFGLFSIVASHSSHFITPNLILVHLFCDDCSNATNEVRMWTWELVELLKDMSLYFSYKDKRSQLHLHQ